MSNEVRALSTRRWERRVLLRGTALTAGGIAAAALIGCGGDDDYESDGQSATPGPTPQAANDPRHPRDPDHPRIGRFSSNPLIQIRLRRIISKP